MEYSAVLHWMQEEEEEEVVVVEEELYLRLETRELVARNWSLLSPQ